MFFQPTKVSSQSLVSALKVPFFKLSSIHSLSSLSRKVSSNSLISKPRSFNNFNQLNLSKRTQKSQLSPFFFFVSSRALSQISHLFQQTQTLFQLQKVSIHMENNKKQKMIKKIGTHSGTFHCDEALACFLLLQTEAFAHSEIIRTRDPKVLETLDIIVDVGAVYDPSKNRFDHHQIEFQGSLNEKYSTRLSSAGLIYKHFGREVIEKIVGNKNHTELLFDKIYCNFIQAIDAIDNGINQYATDQPARYVIRTDLSSRVEFLNPSWNEENVNVDERFLQAVELTGKEFTKITLFYANSWLPARSIVEKAIQDRFSVDPSGLILLMEKFCSWKEHLNDIEVELNIQPLPIYIIFQDSSSWRVSCVPLKRGSFENRLSLPWKGLRDEELSKESGIPGGIFVHATGFVGGNKTKEGAFAMARKALQMAGKI